jgi:iron only hydrogenase large subunit-like protein
MEGWVCYAEKTHPELLPLMSTVKSPMQTMGALLKRLLPQAPGGMWKFEYSP